MNSPLRRIAGVILLFSTSLFAANPLTDYVDWRYHPPHMQVREIQGLQERIRDGKLHLHLHDFLELVLKNSTGIQISRLDVYTAANSIISNKAPYDPLLQAGFSAQRSVSPVSFFGFGTSGTSTGSTSATGTSSNAQPGQASGIGTSLTGQIILPQTISSLSQNTYINYSQLLPSGQTITGNFTVYRSSGDEYPYPALFGSLSIGVTQHLLQGRTNIQARYPLLVARSQLLITSEQTAASVADIVTQAARQYWNAVELRDNIRVQEQNVNLARKSYDRDKQALDLGALARLDIFQSETQVAERNRYLIAARYQYKIALDAMRQLIGADLTPALRETEIVLEDDPAELPPRESILPFEQALKKAMNVRPELLATQQSIANDNLNARIARDQLNPQLDLTLQGGATGPAYPALTASGTPVSGGLPGIGPTLDQVLAFKYPSYGFTLALNFPLRNSTAKAGLSNALVSRVKDEYTRRQTQQTIINDVRQAINNIELADASIEAAVRARDLARKNVAAEQQKYELGTITAFEVLDSQTRLASSESALLAAYVTYQQAYIDYQRATWSLLDGFGIVVETPVVR